MLFTLLLNMSGFKNKLNISDKQIWVNIGLVWWPGLMRRIEGNEVEVEFGNEEGW